MEWRKIITSPWVGLAGVISLVWGIPGMGEDAGVWREWVGTMNSGWHWLATGAGATLVILWLAAKGPLCLSLL